MDEFRLKIDTKI